MEVDKNEVLAKVKVLEATVKSVEADRETSTERTVTRAVKDGLRDRRFSRQVKKDVEALDSAVSRQEKFSTSSSRASVDIPSSRAFVVPFNDPCKVPSNDLYKAEEARAVEYSRRSQANLEAVRGMAKTIRSRRKARPSPPRPLRTGGVEAVKDENPGEQDVIQLE